MRILELSLNGFRNYERFQCAFDPGVNLIVGENAQGKTNLLEAICYLSRGSAFRTRKEAELIRFGAEFAELSARVDSYGREQTLRAVMFPGRRPRQLFLSGVKKSSREDLDGVLNTVLFCPEDLLVLKKGAAERRKLLDDALCQLRPKYARALEEYKRLLAQKAAVLRDRLDRPEMTELLPEYNERMAQTGAILITTRAKYLRQLEDRARAHHEAFSGGKERLSLSYQTVSTVTDPADSAMTVYAQLKEHQRTHYRAELDSMQCLSGPHKDDFEAALNGLPMKAYGSQGQTRTAAISLKLAERDLFEADTGELPVLLLDDVLSELDPGRQDFVLNRIRSGQVFITCCEQDKVTDIGKTIHIENGALLV
ncbi:MAG: DNA replication/repair protein RecF [Oscillospiraceae bacterium]|nr:DNA replication/repair protein RecF [Oscillospiraceae bacterium]